MNHSDDCVPECTEDTSHLMEDGHWEYPKMPEKCRECRQSVGHKMDCSIGRSHSYTPYPGAYECANCGHELTLKGERNTSTYWECSEQCRCTMQGCVPNYE